MATAQLTQPGTETTARTEMKIYMHSWLFYWWPLWAIGFAMAGWTLFEDRHVVLVPAGATVEGPTLVVPAGASPFLLETHLSASPTPGLVFTLTLLGLLAFGTGWMWGWRAYTFSAVVVALLLLFSWLDAWGTLARWVMYLHVHINLGGYLVMSIGLLFIWLVQVFVVDRRTFVTFSPSQVRIHCEIGEEEKVYDAGGLSLEKAPYDWFRWLVGFGAGDVHVRVGGQLIEIPNVIHVGRQLDAIERLLRTKDVE